MYLIFISAFVQVKCKMKSSLIKVLISYSLSEILGMFDISQGFTYNSVMLSISSFDIEI